MSLFKRYIESAASNNPISQKLERILMLIFIPIWLIALIPCLYFVIEGVYSIPLYFKSLELKNKYQNELIINRRNKNSAEQRKAELDRSRNQDRNGVFKFIDSIDKNKPSTKPVITKGFQESQKIDNLTEMVSLDLQSWKEVGIDNPDPYDEGMPDKAISINSNKIVLAIVAFICYVLIFFTSLGF